MYGVRMGQTEEAAKAEPRIYVACSRTSNETTMIRTKHEKGSNRSVHRITTGSDHVGSVRLLYKFWVSSWSAMIIEVVGK